MKKVTLMLEDQLLTTRSDVVPSGREKQFPVSTSGKPRPLKMPGASLILAVTAMLSLCGGQARANLYPLLHVYWFSTGGQQIATADNGGTSAGSGYFDNSINMNYNTAAGMPVGSEAFNQNSTAPLTQTTPTFSSSPVNTALTLNGAVQFSDPNDNNDYITLDLTGLVGTGLQLEIIQTITAAQFRAAIANGYGNVNGFVPFSITTTGVQNVPVNVPTFATENLTITSVGRVLYQNDDTFVGAPDSAPTWLLLPLGLVPVFWYARQRQYAAPTPLGH